MRKGRCRLHGGLSTGPKTAEGIERIRRAQTKHGLYSAVAIAECKRFRAMFKSCREVLFAAKRVFWEKTNTRVSIDRHRKQSGRAERPECKHERL
jgi:hypothetical protein